MVLVPAGDGAMGGAVAVCGVTFEEGKVASLPMLLMLRGCLWVEADYAARLQWPPSGKRIEGTQAVGECIRTEF